MEDQLLYRALVSFIYERRAIRSINNNRIFQSFLECHKYRHLARDRNNVELMMLFHDEVLPNLHQFEYPNAEELAYYEEYNYDQGLGPVLRHAMSENQRYPLDADLSNIQDTNASDSPMVRAIRENNLRDSLLAAEKQQSKNIHQAYICTSYFVASSDERRDGELLPKPEVRKRLLEIRAGERARTDDKNHLKHYALLVQNKFRHEVGLPPMIINDSIDETNSSVQNQTIKTPDQSPAPTGPGTSLYDTFLTFDDFESIEAVNNHFSHLEKNTSTPLVRHRRWSASPNRPRKRRSPLFNPKLGQKFVKTKSRAGLSQSLETIPEHLVIRVRENERRRTAAKFNANGTVSAQSVEPLEQSPISVSQSESSSSESLELLPMPSSQSESTASE